MINLYSPSSKKNTELYTTNSKTLYANYLEQNINSGDVDGLGSILNRDTLLESSLTDTEFNKTNDFNTTKYANELIINNNMVFEDPVKEQDVTNYDSK